MRVLPYGDRALLAEVESLEHAIALHSALEAARPDGVLELVPAARTVLVRVDPGVLGLAAAERWIRAHEGDAPAIALGALTTIPVTYDGPDLEEVATLLGVSIAEVVARHSSAEWRVAFVGFAPGFGYLTAPDVDLRVPRRATSRPRVPAGSVALASEFSAVYPRESPGGWQLIGTTTATLWRPDASDPAVLTPGTRVRFEVAG